MSKKYDKEFKSMIVDLLNSGQTTKQVSADYDLSDGLARRWRREAASTKDSFTGKGNRSFTPEEKEVYELKKALKEAELERDILKKAIAIFSKSDRKNTNS